MRAKAQGRLEQLKWLDCVQFNHK